MYFCIVKTTEAWVSGLNQYPAKVQDLIGSRRFESFCFRQHGALADWGYAQD